MSPKIGLTVEIKEENARSLRPLDKVRAAVGAVEATGHKLSLEGDHGVGRHQVTGRWVADGPYRPRRVSLAGAVCLYLQPLHGQDAEDGAAAALEVDLAWLLGLLDGWDGEAQSTLLEGVSRERYLEGLRAGNVLFAELTSECPECGSRHYGKQDECRRCGRGSRP